MLTDFDVQRISMAIVDNLTHNEQFIKRMAKLMPKRKHMVSSTQAAAILGVSRKTVCELAEVLGGIKGEGKYNHWTFEEDGLKERYLEYKKGAKK